MKRAIESLRRWRNVYRRIRFFKRLYPLRAVLADAVRFPLDYARTERDVDTVRNVMIAVTHRCNIRCEMCYFHSQTGDVAVLPLETFKKVVDETAHSRPAIQLTGGEPLTHPRIVDMVAYAKKKGLAVQLFTNGTLATPDLAGRLVDAGLDYLNMTLLGGPLNHSLVARVPGSYERFRGNLGALARRKGTTRLMVNYTITPRAAGDMFHAFELAHDLGLDGVRVQHLMYLTPAEFSAQDETMRALYGHAFPTNESQEERDLESLGAEVAVLAAETRRRWPGLNVQWAPTLDEAEMPSWYSAKPFSTRRKCLFPWRGIQIDADGAVYPCSKIFVPLGNATGRDVMECWNAKEMKTFRAAMKQGLLPACARCCVL